MAEEEQDLNEGDGLHMLPGAQALSQPILNIWMDRGKVAPARLTRSRSFRRLIC